MKRILIIKDVAIAEKIGGGSISGINEVNLLAAGAIAFFTEDGRMMISQATANTIFTTQPDTKKIYMAVGSGGADGARLSSLIDRNSCWVNQKTYVAPVAQIQVIGDGGAGAGALNLPSPLVVGDSAIIRVINNSAGTQPPINKKTYEYVIKTGDTATQITLGLTNLINNNPDSFVTATNNAGLGITITTDSPDVTAEILMTGVLSSATLDAVGETFTAANRGFGTPAQVAAIELECNPVEGDTNRLYQPQLWFSKASAVDTSATYDMYTLDWDNIHDRPTDRVLATREVLIVAMPTVGATVTKANFEGVLAEAFGVTRVNLETGL